MCLFHFFMDKTVSAVLNARFSVDGTGKKNSRPDRDKITYFTTFPQVVHFFLKKYATDDVITETAYDVTRFAQPSNISQSQYAEDPVTKIFR